MTTRHVTRKHPVEVGDTAWVNYGDGVPRAVTIEKVSNTYIYAAHMAVDRVPLNPDGIIASTRGIRFYAGERALLAHQVKVAAAVLNEAEVDLIGAQEALAAHDATQEANR